MNSSLKNIFTGIFFVFVFIFLSIIAFSTYYANNTYAATFCSILAAPTIRLDLSGGATGSWTSSTTGGSGSVNVSSGAVINANVWTYAEPSSQNYISSDLPGGPNVPYPGPSLQGRYYPDIGPITVSGYIFVDIDQFCEYDGTVPPRADLRIDVNVPPPVPGCTDPAANNYNPSATVNDGSCTYLVNLNFLVKNQTGQSISGASVNIDQDFGNGTNRSSDGSGFANFGVFNNRTIGWSVSANSCSGTSGSVNSGTSGTTVNVNLTCSISCSGSNTQSCTSSANACGQTSSGTQTGTCNTGDGTWGNWGACSASTPANPAGYGNACTSSANICGMTNSGTIQCNGSCSASTPLNSSCPAPNAPANVIATEPNYCASGPAATITWTYSDPSASPQTAYQVQITGTGSDFTNPALDTNKVNSGSTAYFTGQGILLFNTTYRARVRAWNGYDVVSAWSLVSNSWKTPSYAYPQTDFSWTSNGILNNPSPSLNKPVQFTDLTVFGGNPLGRRWSWTLGDGGTSILQNPAPHTYIAEGSYYVTLSATDNANQTCIRTKGPLVIQKPIPQWREVAPR